MSGLIVADAAQRLHVAGGGTVHRQRLAATLRLVLKADLTGLPAQAKGMYDGRTLPLDAMGKPRHDDTSIDGNRYELAFIDLLRRPHGQLLRERMLTAMTLCTNNPDVVDAMNRTRGNVRAVAIAAEKHRIMHRSMLGAYEDLVDVLDHEARVVVPGSTRRYAKLRPAADRTRTTDTRLHALLSTNLTARIDGYPEAVNQLHHADALVGTADGVFWFGVDIKTSRSGRPPQRTRWAGIAIHVDILTNTEVRDRAGREQVSIDEGDGTYPRVTIHAGNSAFRYVQEAQQILGHLHQQGLKPRLPGSTEVDDLAREMLDMRFAPLQDALDYLERCAGDSLVIATDDEVARYGDSDAESLRYGALAG